MKLDISELEILKDISIKAALESGKIIREYKKRGFSISKKDAGTSIASQVLTEVDLLCQDSILELLIPYINKYDLGLLTEETMDDGSRLVKDYFFSIDPMDGTKSFIDSEYGFSISIALVSKTGEPIIGVVYDPVKDNLYHAIKKQGLFKNGVIWKPEFKKLPEKLTVVVDPSFNREGYGNVNFIEYGGAVMNAIQVLEGKADCYLKLPKKSEGGGSIWDFSATALFFIEAGAYAVDSLGNPLHLNNPNTTFMNRSGVTFYLRVEDYELFI